MEVRIVTIFLAELKCTVKELLCSQSAYDLMFASEKEAQYFIDRNLLGKWESVARHGSSVTIASTLIIKLRVT